MDDNELYHYGIKGMKWGVRRTPEQLGHVKASAKKTAGAVGKAAGDAVKKAASKIGEANTARKQKKAAKKMAEEEQKKRRKPLSDMSDTELRNAVERLRLEQQYNQLKPRKVSIGKKFVDDVIIPTATNVTRDYLNKLVKDAMAEKDPLAGLKKDISDMQLKKQRAELEDYFRSRDLNNSVSRLRQEKTQIQLTEFLDEYRVQRPAGKHYKDHYARG